MGVSFGDLAASDQLGLVLLRSLLACRVLAVSDYMEYGLWRSSCIL